MRTGKIIVGILGGIVVLFVLLMLAMWLLVNPNAYKGRIAAAVKEATGRELLLAGDIKLKVFPWIALELGPASLGNPSGFGEEPFLKFNRAAVHVKLLPLLGERLEMGGVELDGLDLRMAKNAEGKGNWEGFGGTKKSPPSPREAPNNIGESLRNLAGIRITNGRVSYQDIVIDKLDFETGAVGGHGVIPLKLGLAANLAPGESVTVTGKLSLSGDSSGEEVHMAAVSFSGLASRPGSQAAQWEISAPAIDVNLTKQTVAAPSFALRYSGAEVTGKLEGTKIIDDLSMAGAVNLAPLGLREFTPRLGIALPKTRDPRVLSQLSASSDFAYDAKGVRLEKIQVQLDDTKLHGDLALQNGEPRALKFNFAADHIDADRYLPPESNAAAPDAAAAKPAETAKKAADAGKPMQMDGTLTLASLIFSKMNFTSISLTVASRDNVIHLFPTQALIDGGRFAGDITLDSRGAVPTVSMDEHLTGIDMTQLLAQTAAKNRLSGKGNVNLKATARGAAPDGMMRSLNGHFDANLADGAVEGVDVAFEIKSAEALIARQAPTGASTGRTKFDAFKMSAEITNGVAVTKDLIISSPVLRVTGLGSANIPSKAIDFQVLASILKSPNATAADIPMKITGTYADPTVRPDLEALAKGQVKQKLQNAVQDKLKSLFGK